MKRKIFFCLLIIVFWLSRINVQASVIITTPNTLDDSYLETIDVVVKKDVDWGKEGEYRVDYFAKSTLKLYSKDVVIKNISELEKGFLYSKRKEISYPQNLNLTKIIYVSNDEYFLIGDIDTKYYPYQTQDKTTFPYVAYYKNDILMWERILKNDRYGVVVDGILTNYGLALLWEYDSVYQGRNIFITLISLDNIILLEKEIYGSLEEYANNIFFYDNYLYFTGISNSKDYDFYNETSSGYDLFVGKIDLSTKDVEIKLFGNSESDSLFCSYFYNNMIYLFSGIRGNGFYHGSINDGKEIKCLLSINLALELEDYVCFGKIITGDKDRIISINDKIIYASLNSNRTHLIIKVYNKILILEKEKQISINKNVRIYDYYLINYQNMLYLFTECIDNQFFEVSYLLDLDLNIYATSENNLDYLYDSLNLLLDNDYFCVLLTNKTKSTVVILKKLFLKLEKELRQTNDYVIDDYLVYLNGVKQTKTIYLENEKDLFGSYSDLYQVKNKDFEIVLPISIYVYPKINVYNDEIYDEGVILKFNGIGYLNDKKIEPNYQILASGKYILEVYGVNNERKVINFTVKKIALDSETLENYLDYEFEKVTPNPSRINNLPINYLENSVKEFAKQEILFIFLPLIFGIAIGVVIPQRKKVMEKC